MQAATAPAPRRPDGRLLVVGADGSLEAAPPRRAPRAAASRRSRGGQRRGHAARQPARRASGERSSRRDPPRRPPLAGLRRRAGVHRGGLWRRRSSHPHRASPPPARHARGRHARAGTAARDGAAPARPPRLLSLCFEGEAEAVWEGIARHGKPVQYAHVPAPLALWDVWTPIAARPVAFEAPSAGFALDWRMLGTFAARGIGFATLTHAAGLSSTGDPALDARLPLDEAY